MKQALALSLLRWVARGWSLVSVLMIAAFAFGGNEGAGQWPTISEWIGLACFPIGVVLGLALAQWRELLGGAAGVGSLLGFYIWLYAVSGRVDAGPWFLILAAPAFLYLLLGVVDRPQAHEFARHSKGRVP